MTTVRLLSTLPLATLAFGLWTVAHGADPGVPDPARRLQVEATWTGNTYVGNPARRHVPHMVSALCVTPDGTVYTGSYWEEACGVIAEMKDGEVTQIPQQMTQHWGNQGGNAVAANDKFLFTAKNDWNGLARFQRQSLLYKEPLRRDLGGHVMGVALTADRVFAACPWISKILILDHDLKDVGSIDLPGRKPDEMLFDAKGRLWVLLPSEHKVICLKPDGTIEPVEIQLPEDCKPVAIAVNPKGELCVADAGPSEQILVYSKIDTKPVLARRIGEKGGVWSGPKRGVPGPLRFNGLSGLGFDRAGNMAVAYGSGHGQGNCIQMYGANLTLTWELHGVIWNECAASDPRDEALVMSRFTQSRLLPGKNPGWRLESYTRDPYKGYTNGDPEEDGMMSPLTLKGKPFFFSRKGHQGTPVYRCDGDKSPLLIPCAFFGEKAVWIDRNGDGKRTADEEIAPAKNMSCIGWGQWIDERGDYWCGRQGVAEPNGVVHVPFAGLDAKGIPTWNVAGATYEVPPAPYTDVRRLRYFPATDTMYCIGYTSELKPGTNEHGVGGRLLTRYDHWRGARTLAWSRQPSYRNDSKEGTLGLDMGVVRCIEVVGDYVFCVFANDNQVLHQGRGHIEVYRTKDGSFVGWIEPPDTIGRIGNQDFSDTVSGRVLSDGRIRLVVEDNECGKAVIYHWKPEALCPWPATPAAKGVGQASGDLVGWWSFDEGKGRSSTNSAPGATTGAALLRGADWTAGALGGGVQLDGKLDRVLVEDGFSPGSMDALTVAFWGYQDVTQHASSGILGKWRSNDTVDFNLDLPDNNGAVRLILGRRFQLSTPVVIPLQKWFHLAATWDGKTAAIYLDGQLKHSVACVGGPIPDTAGCLLNIGRSWDSSWRGKLDEVRIYRRALNAVEIGTLAERPR